VFAFVDSDFPELVACTTTLSAILTQENVTFLSRSIGILSQTTSFSVYFGYGCRSVLKHVLKSYNIFCDQHDNRKRIVGSIYTKQSMS